MTIEKNATVRLRTAQCGYPAGRIGTVVAPGLEYATVDFIFATPISHYHERADIPVSELEVSEVAE